MANITVQLTGASLQVIDSTGSVQRVLSPVPTTSLAASSSFYDAYALIAAGGGSTFALPGSSAWFVYIRSLAGQNGAPNGNLTVTWTPTGGAANPVGVLLPGGILMFANNAESAGGITTLNIASTIASTPAEILLAA